MTTTDNPKFEAAVSALIRLSEHDMFSALFEAVEITRDGMKQLDYLERMDALRDVSDDAFPFDENAEAAE